MLNRQENHRFEEYSVIPPKNYNVMKYILISQIIKTYYLYTVRKLRINILI